MRLAALILVVFLVSTYAFCAPPQLAELTASDGIANDHFGNAVAMSGNTVVVGAWDATIPPNSQEGAVYVYLKPTNGWGDMTQIAKLTPSDGSANQDFGWSVAISGETIVVGTAASPGSGSVYVFVKPASGWKDMTETAKFSVAGANYLGYAVAIEGNTIVAGSAGEAAYVFLKPKKGWASTTRADALLTPTDGVRGDGFGFCLALSGNTVVAGASAGINAEGAAYVFVKPASGWVDMKQTAKLTPSFRVANDLFGTSVAINSGTIVVGAPKSIPNAPVAYVFAQPAGGWTNMTETAQLQGLGWALQSFGQSVAVAGNRIVVGEPYGEKMNPQHGRAYIFTKPKAGWKTTSKYLFALQGSDDTGDGDLFGWAAAMSSARISVGSDKFPFQQVGAAYVF